VRSAPCPKGRKNLSEKARRQIAVVVTVGVSQLAQIVPRPDEKVSFAHDNPRTNVIEAKVSFDGRSNFNGCRGIVRLTMRDWEDRHQRRAVILAFNS
jgi:hypothetical protein